MPLLTLTWSCEKPYEKPEGDFPDSIVFGMDMTWCNDETCVEIFRMDTEGASESTSFEHVDPTVPYDGDFSVQLSPSKYQTLEAMFRDQVPEELLEIPSGLVGTLNNFSNYTYFEYNDGDVHKWWLIEQNFNAIPSSLVNFINLVTNAVFEAQTL